MKKLISLILLTAAIGLQAFPAATFAEEADSSEKVQISVNQSRAERLRNLGMLYDLADGESEDLTKPVSRGEFAKILVKYFNKKALYRDITQKPYVDVELTNKYARDIKVIKDLGFFDAKDLRFRPDEIISISDAAVMILKGLGYENAKKSQALEAGLYKGISKNAEDGAILDDIYAMLENAFKVESVVWSYSKGAVGYSVEKGENVLSQDYNLIQKKGIITATSKTGISEASKSVREGYIEIDNVLYPLKNGEYDDLLGFSVKYYVTDDIDSEVAYIEADKKNTVTVIDAEDINVSDVSETKISYYKDENKIKTLKIENNVDIIYNERAYSGFGKIGNVMPENGNITAIDNDGDGAVEVIKVCDYKYYHVDSVDIENRIIYGKNGTVIDLSDDDAEIEFHTAAGKLINLVGVKKESVISVSESKNNDGNKYIGIIVSDSTVKSEIAKKTDEGLIIDETEYETTPEFYENAFVGQAGVFYISHDGRITFHKSETSDLWNVGVVYRINRDDEENVTVTLYNSDGSFAKYRVVYNVNISKTTDFPNGAKGDSFVLNNVNAGEVIRYKLNGDEEIRKIEIADKGYADASGNRHYVNDTGLRLLVSGNSFYYRNKILDGKYAVRDDTMAFIVPTEEEWSNKEKYFTNISYLFANTRFDYTYPYKAYIYDDSKISTVDVIVFQAEIRESPISTEGQLFAVSDLTSVLYNEDEVYKYVTLVSRGSELNYYCEDELARKYNLKRGDVIQIASDDKRRITNIRKIYNEDKSGDFEAVLVPGSIHSQNKYSQSFYTNGQIIYGTVVRKDEGYIEFDLSTTTDKEVYIANLSPCKVTKHDTKERKVVPAQYDDVVIGDKFVALVSSGLMYDMIIIR